MQLFLLHLSDIHFREADDPILCKIDDIANSLRLLPERPGAIAIACTGDIAFSGSQDQYVLAEKFFIDLATRIQVDYPNCIPHYIFCPGNHDCDFSGTSDLRDLVLESIGSTPGRLNSDEIISKCTAPQIHFKEYQDKFSDITPYHPVSKVHDRYTIQVDSIEVVFNCLNTAWMSTIHEQQGKLLFPEFNLECDSGKDSLVITMFHHPYNWLESINGREFRCGVESQSDIILTGHEHNSSHYLKSYRHTCETMEYLEGGVLQDTGDSFVSEFNLIIIDTTTRKKKQFTFSWSGQLYSQKHGDEEWGTLNANKSRLSNQFIISDAHYAYLTDPGATFTHRIKEKIHLQDIYVIPDLRRINRSERPKTSVTLPTQASTVFENISDNPHLLIVGDEQHGKTTLAKIMFQDFYQRGIIPIILDGHSLKDPDPEKIYKDLKEAISTQYSQKLIEDLLQLDHDKKAVIIDDFHNIPLNSAGKAKLICLLSEIFKFVILFTNDISKIESFAYSEDNKNPLTDFHEYEINEFGNLLREMLIQKWISLGREHTLDEEELYRSTTETKRVVDTLIGKKLLPSTPIFILIILQQIEANVDLATSSGSQGYLYEALITRAIQPHAGSVGVDTAYNYLSEIAFEMFKGKKEYFSEHELQHFHHQYCDEYKLTFNFDKFAKILVSSDVITLYDGIYRFHYKYYYYYFTARHLSGILDSSEGGGALDQLISTIHREESANILIFLTYLAREKARERVIERILSHSRSLYDSYEPCDFEGHVTFINALYDKIPKLVFNDQGVKSHRQRLNKQLDRSGEHGGDSDTIDTAETDILKLNSALKTLQVLGQVLKNFPGSIKGELKFEIANECYFLGLRVLRAITEILGNHTEYFIDYLKKVLGEKSCDSPSECEAKAKRILTFLLESISTGIIKRIANSVGHSALHRTYEDVRSRNDTLPVRIIDLAVKLDHYTNFPGEDLDKLLSDCSSKVFPTIIIRKLVLQHFYLFPTKMPIKQRYCQKLNIELRVVTQLEGGYRRASRKGAH